MCRKDRSCWGCPNHLWTRNHILWGVVEGRSDLHIVRRWHIEVLNTVTLPPPTLWLKWMTHHRLPRYFSISDRHLQPFLVYYMWQIHPPRKEGRLSVIGWTELWHSSIVLQTFWENHDPTQGNRQGNDRGTQYRSGIYYYDGEQKDLAESTREAFQEVICRADQFRSRWRISRLLP